MTMNCSGVGDYSHHRHHQQQFGVSYNSSPVNTITSFIDSELLWSMDQDADYSGHNSHNNHNNRHHSHHAQMPAVRNVAKLELQQSGFEGQCTSWPSPPTGRQAAAIAPSWSGVTSSGTVTAPSSSSSLSTCSAMSSSTALDTLDDSDDLESWRQRHPRQWSSVDVLNFIYSLPRRFKTIKLESLRGEKFQDVTGDKLYRMSRDEFALRDPVHGHLLYDCVRQHLCECESGGGGVLSRSSSCVSSSNSVDQRLSPTLDGGRRTAADLPQPVLDYINNEYAVDDNAAVAPHLPMFENNDDFDYHLDELHLPQPEGGVAFFDNRPIPCFDESSASLGANAIDNASQYLDISLSHLRCSGSTSRSINGVAASTVSNIPQSARKPGGYSGCASTTANGRRSMSEAGAGVARVKRRYVRRSSCPDTGTGSPRQPRSQRGSGAGTAPKMTGGVRNRQEPGKGGHLWEFIRGLLSSSDADTERIIQWEDRNEGVFRIINSKAVARKWGAQKEHRKTTMTYEKLSRALRWCRSDGFLSSVPKDGRYPKKLCFRFGPKATNWRDDIVGLD